MAFYKATKMNEVLIYAITWINTEHMLLGRSQSQKATYSRFHIYEMSRIDKYVEAEIRLLATWAKEAGRKWGVIIMDMGFLLWVMKMF